ncbi:MAG TPA: transglutaminaseTgpA domain-containing protein [Dehalococcoidales bacterium]|nr:transglutaminaseTgpA domain-containing protein [Dehalococcoidales bacterium]
MLKLRGKKPNQSKETISTGYRIWAINWQFALNLLLLFIVLETGVFSVERAHWTTPQPSLTLTLILSVLAALVFTRLPLRPAFRHICMVVLGLLISTIQIMAITGATGVLSRLERVVAVVQPWKNPDTLLFAVFMVVLVWFIGYLSTWFLLRRHNPWVAVSMGALVLIINLNNLAGGYYLYFLVFIVSAGLFIGHTRLFKPSARAGFKQRGWVYAGAALLCVTVLSANIAWVTPALRAPGLETFLAAHTLWKKNVEGSSLNLFNQVPSKQEINAANAQSRQDFTLEWHQSDTIDFTVDSSRPSYWRVRVYDVYKSTGWENSSVTESLLEQRTLWDNGLAPSSNTMTYTVSPGQRSDIVLLAGNFVSSDNPALVQVSAGDITSVTMPRVFRPGDKYSVTSGYSAPSNSDLVRSRGSYPAGIAQYYLQLPDNFPDSVRKQAALLTVGARTPYEKVIAISKYLTQFPYQVKINAPPKDTDPVAYFLFQQKSGFCLYYASAMAVMLRSVGVPARLAVGYLPGDPGKQPGQYLLRDNDYHAWPQIYFSGYGWMDFESTPAGTGSGIALDTPWVSDEALAQLPEWDVWASYPGLDELTPPAASAADASAVKQPGSGQFFFARQLGIAIVVIFFLVFVLLVLSAPVLALRAAFYRWLWRVDRDRLSSLAYDKLCNLAARIGLGPQPHQTPLEFAAALSTEFPAQSADFNHIAKSYIAARFGQKGEAGLFEEAELLKARCRAYGALIKRLGLAGELTRVHR